jgi:hypothetical protein
MYEHPRIIEENHVNRILTKSESLNISVVPDAEQAATLPSLDRESASEQVAIYPSNGETELVTPEGNVYRMSDIAQEAHTRILERRRQLAEDPSLRADSDQTVRDIDSAFTKVPVEEAPQDYAMLREMAGVLAPGQEVEIMIIKDSTRLGLSLPNRVYLSEELLEKHRDDPEAIMGVMAHEIYHATHDHAYLLDKTINREDGNSDQVRELLVQHYISRMLEADADIGAGAMLRAAGISLDPMKRFLYQEFSEHFETQQAQLEQYISPEQAKAWVEVLNDHAAPYRREHLIGN